jgi:hypothetical protein
MIEIIIPGWRSLTFLLATSHVRRGFNEPRASGRDSRQRNNVFTAFVRRCTHASNEWLPDRRRACEEIAAHDDAACRDAGTKPETPAYAKCREDMSNRRQMSQMASRIGMQNQIWSQQEMTRNQMMMGH